MSKAQKRGQGPPELDPKGFRDLATAYEAKGDTAGAISALQPYTTSRPKDVSPGTSSPGCSTTPGAGLPGRIPDAYKVASSCGAEPGSSSRPEARDGDRHEPDRAGCGAARRRGGERPEPASQLAYTARSTRTTASRSSQPKNANTWFSARAGRPDGRRHDHRHQGLQALPEAQPGHVERPRSRQLIKQLSPAPARRRRRSSALALGSG